MKSRVLSRRLGALSLFAASVWSGCSSSGGAPTTDTSNDASVTVSSGHSSGGGGNSSGASGSGSSGAGVGTSGAGTSGSASGAATGGGSTIDGALGGDDASGVATTGSDLADGSVEATSARADARPETGGSSSGGGDSGAASCNLPATVSFKNDVLPFLTTSCGGSGCHVIDAVSTTSGGGFDHGYDWITAGAHSSSCPASAAGTVPKRFEVAIAVINQANPPSCSHSRKMPPPGSAQAPLTPCQIAALQAWLNEPMVTQTHRPDTTSPTTPYAMPPFN
ncbi:MAG: hypothetical protein M3O50_14140 [Myxococcota bacterium]|nr:hypothetical protein [Myxococcota bacterium]